MPTPIRLTPTPVPTLEATLRSARGLTIALWVLQGVVAIVFLMAGSAKLVMPVEAMVMPVALPVWFLRFLGVAEVLGAVGLIVPCATRIRPGLTPLAACGLIVIMAGAVGVTLLGGGGAQALGPVVIGGLLGFIVQGRTRRVPVPSRPGTPTAAVREVGAMAVTGLV